MQHFLIFVSWLKILLRYEWKEVTYLFTGMIWRTQVDIFCSVARCAKKYVLNDMMKTRIASVKYGVASNFYCNFTVVLVYLEDKSTAIREVVLKLRQVQENVLTQKLKWTNTSTHIYLDKVFSW